ncbi:MAG: 3-deoxy-7-phosphoheptulonate synthase, partial [Clostridia bacterium]
MFEVINTVMSPNEVKSQLPLASNLAAIKMQRDEVVKDIIAGRDSRKLIVVGPCSADNEEAVCDYIARLAKV